MPTYKNTDFNPNQKKGLIEMKLSKILTPKEIPNEKHNVHSI